jgi:hypothetical protein
MSRRRDFQNIIFNNKSSVMALYLLDFDLRIFMKKLSVLAIFAILATVFGASSAKALESSPVSVDENLMSSNGQSTQIVAQMDENEGVDQSGDDLDEEEEYDDDMDEDDDDMDEDDEDMDEDEGIQSRRPARR